MFITVSKIESGLKISLGGKLDDEGAQKLRQRLAAENLGLVELMVFDFAQLEYVSSHGIGALAEIYKRLSSHGGSLHIENAPTDIKKLMTLMQLQKIFVIS